MTEIPLDEDEDHPDLILEVTLDIIELQEAKRGLADPSEGLSSLLENSRDPVYVAFNLATGTCPATREMIS